MGIAGIIGQFLAFVLIIAVLNGIRYLCRKKD